MIISPSIEDAKNQPIAESYLNALIGQITTENDSRLKQVDITIQEQLPKEVKLVLKDGKLNGMIRVNNCEFVIENDKIKSSNGGVYTVSAELRVKPLNIDPDMDDLIVSAGTEGIDINDLMNPLEQLVNESLPDALEKL